MAIQDISIMTSAQGKALDLNYITSLLKQLLKNQITHMILTNICQKSGKNKYFIKFTNCSQFIKEFFNISPKEAINILSNHFHQEVHFSDMEEEE